MNMKSTIFSLSKSNLMYFMNILIIFIFFFAISMNVNLSDSIVTYYYTLQILSLVTLNKLNMLIIGLLLWITMLISLIKN